MITTFHFHSFDIYGHLVLVWLSMQLAPMQLAMVMNIGRNFKGQIRVQHIVNKPGWTSWIWQITWNLASPIGWCINYAWNLSFDSSNVNNCCAKGHLFMLLTVLLMKLWYSRASSTWDWVWSPWHAVKWTSGIHIVPVLVPPALHCSPPSISLLDVLMADCQLELTFIRIYGCWWLNILMAAYLLSYQTDVQTKDSNW